MRPRKTSLKGRNTPTRGLDRMSSVGETHGPAPWVLGFVRRRLGALEYLLSGSVAVGVRCAPPNLQGFVAQDKHFHGLFALQQLRYDAAVMSHHLFHLGVLLGRDANAKPFTWSHKAQT